MPCRHEDRAIGSAMAPKRPLHELQDYGDDRSKQCWSIGSDFVVIDDLAE